MLGFNVVKEMALTQSHAWVNCFYIEFQAQVMLRVKAKEVKLLFELLKQKTLFCGEYFSLHVCLGVRHWTVSVC